MIISYKPGRDEKLHIYVDGEYSMTVDRAFAESTGLRQNIEMNEEELAELRRAVSSRRAFNKALDLLEMRDHSARELKKKLWQKGHGEYAEEAIGKLEELGLVDDRRFAEAYVEELVRVKSFGRRRVVSELYKKGISGDIIEEVTRNMETDIGELKELINKKYIRNLNDESGIRRTVNGLVRMGYDYSDIKAALSELEEEEEE